MILPIYLYGNPVLRKVTQKVKPDYANLAELITNMFETMNHAEGVGLAAPQVGLDLQLFVVDSSKFKDKDPSIKNHKRVFINPHIVEEWGEPWSYSEGCLSIPYLYGDVSRKAELSLRYQDEHFQEKTETFDGFFARVIQHEYDHLQGKLFIDYLPLLQRNLIGKKLERMMTEGKYEVDYPAHFLHKK
jgi:peptide deformylase